MEMRNCGERRTLGVTEIDEDLGQERVLQLHVLQPEVRNIQGPNETLSPLKRALV